MSKSVLAEWIGEGGKPVAHSLAEMRAWVCEYCPENVEPGWWDRIKSNIAETIRAWLEEKNKMGLRVSNEEKLGMCKICGCCNRLLVHTPFNHIRKHMTPEQAAKYPRSCWKSIALKELTQPTHD